MLLSLVIVNDLKPGLFSLERGKHFKCGSEDLRHISFLGMLNKRSHLLHLFTGLARKFVDRMRRDDRIVATDNRSPVVHWDKTQQKTIIKRRGKRGEALSEPLSVFSRHLLD